MKIKLVKEALPSINLKTSIISSANNLSKSSITITILLSIWEIRSLSFSFSDYTSHILCNSNKEDKNLLSIMLRAFR